MKKALLTTFIIFSGISLFAQGSSSISLSSYLQGPDFEAYPLLINSPLSSPVKVGNSLNLPDNHIPNILPDHAKENPSGYSFLCNLELDIENKAPVGVWVNIPDQPFERYRVPVYANVEFKLFRF